MLSNPSLINNHPICQFFNSSELQIRVKRNLVNVCDSEFITEILDYQEILMSHKLLLITSCRC